MIELTPRLVLVLRGDLDATSGHEFRSRFGRAVAGWAGLEVELDVGEVNFTDVSGARDLLWAADLLREHDGTLRIVKPNPRLLRLLNVLQLDDHLLIDGQGQGR